MVSEVGKQVGVSREKTFPNYQHPIDSKIIQAIKEDIRTRAGLCKKLGVSEGFMSKRLKSLREGGHIEERHFSRIRVYGLNPHMYPDTEPMDNVLLRYAGDGLSLCPRGTLRIRERY